jgi:hypothetical protein
MDEIPLCRWISALLSIFFRVIKLPGERRVMAFLDTEAQTTSSHPGKADD